MNGTLLRLAYEGYRMQRRVTQPITMGVRILLVQDGGVLLVRHTYHPDWNFPGGGLKHGETLVEAALREAREEVGAQALSPPYLLGLYSNFGEGRSDHIAVFVCERYALHPPTDTWEIGLRALFAQDNLPPDVTPGCRRRIYDYRSGGGPFSGLW